MKHTIECMALILHLALLGKKIVLRNRLAISRERYTEIKTEITRGRGKMPV
jgi:hypothetical protein